MNDRQLADKITLILQQTKGWTRFPGSSAAGILNLRLPTGLPEADVEVVVIVHPVDTNAQTWPEDFFTETYGAFADHPL